MMMSAERAARPGWSRWTAALSSTSMSALDKGVEFALEAVERGIEEFAAWDDDKVEA